MSNPEPPSALDGRCSVVYDNTVYVYTPSTLLSLPLEQEAEWSSAGAGQSVAGAVCVTGSIDGSADNQALYVVGGTSDNSSYTGLQRYSFANQDWETIALNTMDMQNRVNHSAIYLPGTTSILVYAGSAESNQDASTSTFEIPVTNGWIVQSRSASGIAPGIQPRLLPYDNSTAVYVGGTPTDTEVFLYHGGTGWSSSQISLADGIPSNAGVAIQSNTDGSKFLEIFDLNVSPNNVSYVALLQTGGTPAYPGESVTFTSSTSSSTKKRKRDWGDMPSDNGTAAPSTTRSSFSLAQSDNGLVVIASGSGNKSLTIFNQTQNSWVNTTELFYNSDISAGLQQPVSAPLSTTAAATTSATVTATTAPATSSTGAASSGGSDISTGTVIGATLGSLLGIAAILVVLLVLLRHLHRKKAGSAAKGGRRYGSDDKDRLSFQDQGIEPLTMSAVPMGRSHVPSAVDSIYMISGKFAEEHRISMANQNQVKARSLVPPAKSSLTTIASSRADRLDTTNESDRQRGDRTTDEGWGKYFQDGTAADLTTQSPRTTMNSDISEMTKSDYRSSMWPSQVPETTTYALGGLDESRPLGQVPSGSPNTEHQRATITRQIHEGQAAHISSADSVSFLSDEDDHDRHDAFSSGIPQSVHDGSSHWPQPWNLRPTSSNYTDSFYQASARAPSGIPEPAANEARSYARRSSGILHDDPDYNSQRQANSDMSWLNLHAGK